MKTPIVIAGEAWLEYFSVAILDSLTRCVSSISGSSPEFVNSDSYACTKEDLISENNENIFFVGTEIKNNFPIGLLFKVNDIEALADMVLLGEGKNKADFKQELNGALQQIGKKFFDILAPVLESQFNKSFEFKFDMFEKIQDYNFLSDTYDVLIYKGILRSNSFSVATVLDLKWKDYFHSIQSNNENSGDTNVNLSNFAKAKSHLSNMDMLLDIEIPVIVKLGSSKLFLKDILGLGPGNIVELDQDAGDPVELLVNGKLVAHGEVVIVDGYFGFRIKEIISKADRIRKLKD